MKAFSFLTQKNEMNIGIRMEDEDFNLTQAFDIYQRAKHIQQPVSFSYIQVMVEMGYFSSQTVEKIFSDPWVQAKKDRLKIDDTVRFDLPIARPSKIICIGRNYLAHARELNHEVPAEPVYFAKAPSSLLPHEADIVIPSWFEGRVDHEAELAFVIGKAGRDIPESEAMDHIAGYTIANDVTARSMQKDDIAKGNPWFRSKSFDTFCPTGPFLVPPGVIPDPHDLEIKLTVNGQVRQQAGTSQMLFRIPQLIHAISRCMTLQPGDIIATGTPEGVSELKPGDIVDITITGLGTLRNRVTRGA